MIPKNLKKIAVATGFFLGAFALSVLAESLLVWTPASCAAPDCNTAAPINVSAIKQHKEGSLAINTTSDPADGVALDVNGIATLKGLNVSGDAIVSKKVTAKEVTVLTKLITDTIAIGGVDMSKKDYILTNDGTGNATWKTAILNIDITTWPRAWYGAVSKGETEPFQMAKIPGPANYSQHDMGGCPPKAIMVGSDKNGAGNLSVFCAAPTAADLPDSFSWDFL